MRTISAWVIATLTVLPLALAAPQAISRTARCGAQFELTCEGSAFGDCCSQHGYCGSTKNYCGTGCQADWGACDGKLPSAQLKVSKNGKCGGSTRTTCLGSTFGNCCSQHGYCGFSQDYCGAGCNALFGSCSQSPSPSSKPVSRSFTTGSAAAATSAVTALPASSNGRCGYSHGAAPGGMTCHGSKFGNCCSQWSYCGSTADYCGTGCQLGFGDCLAASRSSSASSFIRTTLTTQNESPSSSTSQPSSTLSGDAIFSKTWSSTSTTVSSSAIIFSTSLSSTSIVPDSATLSLSSSSSALSETMTSSAESSNLIVATSPASTTSVATTILDSTSSILSGPSLDYTSSSVQMSSTGTTSSSIFPSSLTSTSIVLVETATSSSTPLSSETTSFSLTVLSSPSPSSSAATATPTPSSNEKKFCLKVVNPGSPIYGHDVRITGRIGAMHVSPPDKTFNYNRKALFTLNAQGQLVLAEPVNGLICGTGSREPIANGYLRTMDNPTETTCIIRTDLEGYIGQSILRCTTLMTGRTHTGFRARAESIVFLQTTDDFRTDTALSYLIELGVFPVGRGDCPIEQIASSTVSSKATLSTSTVSSTTLASLSTRF